MHPQVVAKKNNEVSVGRQTAMGLSMRTLLAVAVSMSLLLAVMAILLRKVILSGFDRLETISVVQSLGRVTDALDQRVRDMDSKCIDWTNWTDMWQYCRDSNQAFVSGNLSDGAMRAIGVNYLLINDLSGKALYKARVDLHSEKPCKMTDRQYAALMAGIGMKPMSGIRSVGSEIVIFAARPVLKTDGKDKPMGTLLMATVVDRPFIAKIGAITHTDTVFGRGNATANLDSIVTSPKGEPIYIKQAGSAKQATQAVRDIQGVPAFYVTLLVPPDIDQQSKRVTTFVMIGMVIGGVWLVATALFVVQFAALRRTAILSREVTAIRMGDSTVQRVSEGRHDEIGHLARSVNALLEIRERDAAELVRSHQSLQRYFAAVPFMVMVFDSEGLLLERNESSGALFPKCDDERRDVYLWDIPVAAERAELLDAMLQAYTHRTAVALPRCSISTGSGERYFDAVLGCIDTGEQPGRFLLSVADVTEQQELQERLLQSKKLESIGQLAAGIAHEINTPIQYVSDNARFVQDASQAYARVIEAVRRLERDPNPADAVESILRLMDDEDIGFYLDQVPAAVGQSIEGLQRISTIVRAMKEFSHPDLHLWAASDLNRAVENTVNVSRNEWKYVAEMELRLDPALPPVQCAVDEINQVVLNLIVNAAHAVADAAQGTEEKGRITVTTRRSGDEHVEILIADTGTGIPATARSRVFDPFFTTKDVGKGTGQGLSIARNIVVKHHGGTLDFVTTEGDGTTFRILLPIAHSAAEPTKEAV